MTARKDAKRAGQIEYVAEYPCPECGGRFKRDVATNECSKCHTKRAGYEPKWRTLRCEQNGFGYHKWKKNRCVMCRKMRDTVMVYQ